MADSKIALGVKETELDELWNTYHAIEERHYQEVAAEKLDDKNRADKEEADRIFNETATEVVNAYNSLVNEMQRFQNLLNAKVVEKETLESETDEEILMENESKISLLGEYVDVYQQQVDALEIGVEAARE